MTADPQRFTPEEKERRLAAANIDRPVMRMFGLRFVDTEPGYARLEFPHSENFANRSGALHGGTSATLVDEAMARALSAALPEGTGQTAIELKVNFVSPGTGGTLVAEGRVVRAGGRVAVVEGKLMDGAGTVVAQALATYAIFRRKGGGGD